jgi:hypothetical protein
LSDAELDQLWRDFTPHRGITDEQLVANALSGNDAEAARSLLFWISVAIRDEEEMTLAVRMYGSGALERFFKGGVTLGEAFGTERKRRRGPPPTRSGVRQLIVSLIQYLNQHRGFPLSDSGRRPSAFLVAATLMQRRRWTVRSPTTLRDEYWNKRDKGE